MYARVLSIVAAGLGALACAAPTVAADPGQTGRWSPLQQYPVTPISAAVLPDGTIVAWDQADTDAPHSISPSNGRAVIIDPERGVIARSANLAPSSVFCPLISTLPDGKIAIVGGGNDTYNSDRTILYDPATKSFGAWGTISVGRWYPGGNIDARANIVALGGRGGSGGDYIDAATGFSRRLGINFGGDYYPHVLRAPDGRFVVENISQTNAPSRQWLTLAGAGSLTGIGDRSLLQSRRRLTATMVGPYTTLMAGGAALRTAYTIDISSGTPVTRPTGTMKFAHMTGTAVTLPDGSALVIGGNKGDSETGGTPTMTPELWSPGTGQWTSMEDSPRRRLYHSVAALLPDGRVWSAGTSAYGENEYNGAYFSPPYLFRKDGSGQPAPRPQISSAPATAAWGERITVRSPQAATVRGAALIRLAATTHQYAFDQTYVPLDVAVSGDQLAMSVPANGNTIPAGRYMLFVVDRDGVPSKAKIVEITPTSTTPPAPVATQSSQYTSLFGSAGKAFDGSLTNANGTWFAGSHTDLEKEPWWQVDLGRSKDLESVTIANRTGAGSERLRDAWVFASDAPLTATTVAETRAQPGVTSFQISSTPGATVTVPLGRTARYLRVQSPRTDYLNLREVIPNERVAAAQLDVARTRETATETTVTVTNTGAGPGVIQSVSLPGSTWSQVSGPAAPFTVAAGGQTTIVLRRGSTDGDLVLTPSSGTALRLGLTGALPPVDSQPTLGVALAGQTDTTATVKVMNTGTTPGTILSLSLPGTGWSLAAGPAPVFSVAPGAELTLTFTRGAASGDLVLNTGVGLQLRLRLTGAATPPPPPPPPSGTATFAIGPGGLAFSARLGRTSVAQSLTVRNTGTAAGSPGPIALTERTNDFSIAGGTCGTATGRGMSNVVTLAPGATCTVALTFSSFVLGSSYGGVGVGSVVIPLSGRTRLF